MQTVFVLVLFTVDLGIVALIAWFLKSIFHVLVGIPQRLDEIERRRGYDIFNWYKEGIEDGKQIAYTTVTPNESDKQKDESGYL